MASCRRFENCLPQVLVLANVSVHSSSSGKVLVTLATKATLRAVAIAQKALDSQTALGVCERIQYLAVVCALCVPVAFVLKKAQSKAAAA